MFALRSSALRLPTAADALSSCAMTSRNETRIGLARWSPWVLAGSLFSSAACGHAPCTIPPSRPAASSGSPRAITPPASRQSRLACASIEATLGPREEPWATVTEQAIRSHFEALPGNSVQIEWLACGSTACLLQVSEVERAQQLLEGLPWTYFREEASIRQLEGPTLRVARLWRHPADASGDPTEGQTSVAAPLGDPCLAGLPCGDRGQAAPHFDPPGYVLPTGDGESLCFVTGVALCHCQESLLPSQDCKAADYEAMAPGGFGSAPSDVCLPLKP